MRKISSLLMMALLAIGMGLTSCDEQLDNAVVPGVTPGTDEGEVTSITVDLSKIDEKYLDTEKTKLQLTVGDEVTLSFTILPEEMASTEVELTSADATILSIDGLKVKALKEGETKVTAKAGEKTAECTVTVAKKAAEVIMYSFKVTNLAGDDQTNAVTSLKMSKPAAGVPAFCTMNEDERCVFFEAPAAWGQIYVWAWMNGGDGKDYLGTSWPGVTATKLGTAGNGNSVWKWNVSGSVNPDNIIFSGGSEQTADLKFTNGGYYGKEGLKATVTPEYEAEVSGGKITIKAENLSGITAAADFWFEAEIGGKPYIAKVSIDPTTLSPETPMTLAMATLGDVILSDGKFAAPSSTGAKVAMIAYLGNGSECNHGLAIQLNGSPVSKNWNEAKAYTSYPTLPAGTGTWRLPSKEDWQNMFVGCAKDGDDSDASDNSLNPIKGFKEKIGATGITWKWGNYWSSTDSGSDAWYVNVDLDDSNAYAGFYTYGTSTQRLVLGCLAF